MTTPVVSEVSICNQALSWLGENLIISLDDDTKAAGLCKTNYYSLRDAVLEARDWTFAQKRDIPAPLATPPVWGYSQQFQLPADLLRVIFVGTNDDPQERSPAEDWLREQDKILANYEVIYIRYVARIEDPNKFSMNFVQALAGRLAADLAMPLTNSRGLQSDMYKLYGTKLAEATAFDQMQGKSRIIRADDLRVRARLGGSF